MDGDGFQEYQRRTPKGAENQGWKDSGNAVLDEDGDDVPAPKALCELQGYVYDAWRRMAAIYDELVRAAGEGRPVSGRRPTVSTVRFNAAFWDETLQFYALCLDPAKKRVMSIASNPGPPALVRHRAAPERAAAVARRLMAEDMWSGWGVRTLSSAHPAYNPHDYQLGAIWPHDNGLIAIGLARYGFRAEAARIVEGLVEAGSRFLLHRLPEVFAGTSRSDSPFPVQYLGANVPQAWAAGSVFSLVHVLRRAEPRPRRTSTLLPSIPICPDWLPETPDRASERRTATRSISASGARARRDTGRDPAGRGRHRRAASPIPSLAIYALGVQADRPALSARSVRGRGRGSSVRNSPDQQGHDAPSRPR